MTSISQRATAGIGRNRPPEKVCKCCGQELPSPRNAERHKLFFAVLPKAFAAWPETHEFQPLSREHLRGYLLVESGWCTVRDITIGGPSKQHAANCIRYFLDDGDGARFYSMTATGIRERRPKSIAWNKCKEAEFRKILDTSAEIIQAAIGVPIEALKRETAA